MKKKPKWDDLYYPTRKKLPKIELFTSFEIEGDDLATVLFENNINIWDVFSPMVLANVLITAGVNSFTLSEVLGYLNKNNLLAKKFESEEDEDVLWTAIMDALEPPTEEQNQKKFAELLYLYGE